MLNTGRTRDEVDEKKIDNLRQLLRRDKDEQWRTLLSLASVTKCLVKTIDGREPAGHRPRR
jgi:hypothetical protein